MEAAPSRWPRDKPSAGRGREGAVSLTVGTGDGTRHGEPPQPSSSTASKCSGLVGGCGFLPGAAEGSCRSQHPPWLVARPPGRRRESAWFGSCHPTRDVLQVQGGWRRGLGPLGTGEGDLGRNRVPGQGHPTSADIPGRGEEQDATSRSPSVPWGLVHLSVAPAPSWSIKDTPLLWAPELQEDPARSSHGKSQSSPGAQGCSAWSGGTWSSPGKCGSSCTSRSSLLTGISVTGNVSLSSDPCSSTE